jgi:hypothetical protein
MVARHAEEFACTVAGWRVSERASSMHDVSQ